MRRTYPTFNQIKIYRIRMGFQQRQVAQLLGHRDGSALSVLESGQKLPGLTEALRLSVVLRVPVEFLFPALYQALREEIRSLEA